VYEVEYEDTLCTPYQAAARGKWLCKNVVDVLCVLCVSVCVRVHVCDVGCYSVHTCMVHLVRISRIVCNTYVHIIAMLIFLF